MDTRMVTLNTQPGHVDGVAVFWDDAVVAEITAQAGSRGLLPPRRFGQRPRDRALAVGFRR